MIGSPARERAFQASQSPFTLRQTRLTVSPELEGAHSAAKQGGQRPADPPRVGSGEIGRGNQRISRLRAALIGA